jgi:hypothetical protein
MYVAKIMISKQNSSMKSTNPMQAFDQIIRCTLYVHINIPNCWKF